MPTLLLGLDLGTTSTKGALVDPERGLGDALRPISHQLASRRDNA